MSRVGAILGPQLVTLVRNSVNILKLLVFEEPNIKIYWFVKDDIDRRYTRSSACYSVKKFF